MDLIYKWGGRSGRMFYFPKGEDGVSARANFINIDSQDYIAYISGARMAQNGENECIQTFRKIRGVGLSFASKFAFFWSAAANRRLIIVDSKIAGSLGFVTLDQLYAIYTYKEIIDIMSERAQLEFGCGDASLTEKAIFAFHKKHFLNSNKNFGPMHLPNEIDFQEANRIGALLF